MHSIYAAVVATFIAVGGCNSADPDQNNPPAPGDSGAAGDTLAGDQLQGDAQSGEPPAGWTCPPFYYGDYGSCDCGCGVPDIDCGAGVGCSANGCMDAACGVCWQDGFTINCVEVTLPSGWTCESYAYGDGECDCGCGVEDLDCVGAAGCTAEGCVAADCVWCNTSAGWLDCDVVDVWTCDPWFYEAMNGCDCGCGAVDPDCEGTSCIEPSCTAAGCDTCFDAEDNEIPCN